MATSSSWNGRNTSEGSLVAGGEDSSLYYDDDYCEQDRELSSSSLSAVDPEFVAAHSSVSPKKEGQPMEDPLERPPSPPPMPLQAGPTMSRSSSAGSNGPPQLEPHQVRTSFTAESPYFSAFVDKEHRSLQILGGELHNISTRTQTLVRTGKLMSEAARRLAVACRLRRDISDPSGGDDSAAAIDEEKRQAEEEAVQERKLAVGDEMVRLLDVLGEVRTIVLSRTTQGFRLCLTCVLARPVVVAKRMI